MAGLELPEYLGKMSEDKLPGKGAPAAPKPKGKEAGKTGSANPPPVPASGKKARA
jgi:hypothetical protein